MKISIITLFPKMISGFFEESIASRAIKSKLVEIEIVNLRNFAKDKYGTVDDKPYGGGAGMILKADIVWAAFNKLKVKSDPSGKTQGHPERSRTDEKLKVKTILTSPKGMVYSQDKAREYSKLEHLVIIAGHYEGVDGRVLNFVDEEVSIGDFVLTGGEIAACAIVDSVVRLLPGVLKKQEATEKESFNEVSIDDLIAAVGKNKTLENLKNKNIKKVKLLEYPQYTRPEKVAGLKVPEVLFSGDHGKIEAWRLKKAFGMTLARRPDLLA